MNRRRRAAPSGARCRTCLAFVVSILACTPGLAQQYTIVDLGTLGGSTSAARGINCSGVVAGESQEPSSVNHAVLWDGSGIMDLGAPAGFIVSEAVAVNRAGQVAGNGEGDPQALRAYLWEDGVWTPLGVLPGRSESVATAIDWHGRIAGRSFTLGVEDSRAFLWEGGMLNDLGALGGDSRAYGMNDLPQVVGSSLTGPSGSARHAFLWQDGVMADLGVLPGEDHSQALDINSAGDVVGSSWHVESSQLLQADQATLWRDGGAEIVDLGLTPGPDVCIDGFPFYTVNVAEAVNDCGQIVGHARCLASGAARVAFLWEDGVMHNLNDRIPAGSGWDLLRAHDINDRGQIVGIGLSPGGQLHGFLLEPDQPPPCPLTLAIDPSRLTWIPQPGAIGYDVVRGDLGTLRGTSGDFTQATAGCLANDVTSAMVDDASAPAPGGGFWFLVRFVSETGPGTYDDGAGQVAARDQEIDASPSACP